jgi:hypothetical protein
MFFSKITFTGDGATFETAVVGNKTEAEVTFFEIQRYNNLCDNQGEEVLKLRK